MATYLILSTLAPDTMHDPDELRRLADAVSRNIKATCPSLRWSASYVLDGRFHAADIVEADSPAEVELAAEIIRRHGRATTETLRATPRKEFLANLPADHAANQGGWRWELGHSGGF